MNALISTSTTVTEEVLRAIAHMPTESLGVLVMTGSCKN